MENSDEKIYTLRDAKPNNNNNSIIANNTMK